MPADLLCLIILSSALQICQFANSSNEVRWSLDHRHHCAYVSFVLIPAYDQRFLVLHWGHNFQSNNTQLAVFFKLAFHLRPFVLNLLLSKSNGEFVIM